MFQLGLGFPGQVIGFGKDGVQSLELFIIDLKLTGSRRHVTAGGLCDYIALVDALMDVGRFARGEAPSSSMDLIPPSRPSLLQRTYQFAARSRRTHSHGASRSAISARIMLSLLS